MINQFLRLVFRLMISLLAGNIAVSCQLSVRHIAQEIDEFHRTSVILPSDLLRIPASDEMNNCFSPDDSKPKLIIYADSTECTRCLIANLGSFRQLDSLSLNGKLFTTYIVLSPPASTRKSLVEELEIFPPSKTVYLDVTGSFVRSNKSIPSDALYHAFLLDQDNHPIFVGNPLTGDKTRRAFMNALSEISD